MSAEFDAAIEICGPLKDIDANLDRIYAALPDRRERIATAALHLFTGHIRDNADGKPDCSVVAKIAVAVADALIAQLDAKTLECDLSITEADHRDWEECDRADKARKDRGTDLD